MFIVCALTERVLYICLIHILKNIYQTFLKSWKFRHVLINRAKCFHYVSFMSGWWRWWRRRRHSMVWCVHFVRQLSRTYHNCVFDRHAIYTFVVYAAPSTVLWTTSHYVNDHIFEACSSIYILMCTYIYKTIYTTTAPPPYY